MILQGIFGQHPKKLIYYYILDESFQYVNSMNTKEGQCYQLFYNIQEVQNSRSNLNDNSIFLYNHSTKVLSTIDQHSQINDFSQEVCSQTLRIMTKIKGQIISIDKVDGYWMILYLSSLSQEKVDIVLQKFKDIDCQRGVIKKSVKSSLGKINLNAIALAGVSGSIQMADHSLQIIIEKEYISDSETVIYRIKIEPEYYIIILVKSSGPSFYSRWFNLVEVQLVRLNLKKLVQIQQFISSESKNPKKQQISRLILEAYFTETQELFYDNKVQIYRMELSVDILTHEITIMVLMIKNYEWWFDLYEYNKKSKFVKIQSTKLDKFKGNGFQICRWDPQILRMIVIEPYNIEGQDYKGDIMVKSYNYI